LPRREQDSRPWFKELPISPEAGRGTCRS
jgi:hypothetical protein